MAFDLARCKCFSWVVLLRLWFNMARTERCTTMAKPRWNHGNQFKNQIVESVSDSMIAPPDSTQIRSFTFSEKVVSPYVLPVFWDSMIPDSTQIRSLVLRPGKRKEACMSRSVHSCFDFVRVFSKAGHVQALAAKPMIESGSNLETSNFKKKQVKRKGKPHFLKKWMIESGSNLRVNHRIWNDGKRKECHFCSGKLNHRLYDRISVRRFCKTIINLTSDRKSDYQQMKKCKTSKSAVFGWTRTKK